MNFLAHLYLSGSHPGVMVGNFIGDFVKGRDLAQKFNPEIALGVEMHRGIDAFTDQHPVVKKSKDRLRPKYRHYSGVITDIFFDHFLAANWNQYSNEPLKQYAARAYKLVSELQDTLPIRVKQMLPYMVKGNWLVSYGELEGIQKALSGMARRTTFESGMEKSVEDLKSHYSDFRDEFDLFFPDLKRWADEWLMKNISLLS